MAIRHRPQAHVFKRPKETQQGAFNGTVQATPARKKRANVLAEELLESGCMFVEKQVWDEAQNKFDKALQMEPDYAEAYNNLGVCLLYQGKPQEAAEALQTALQYFPNWAVAEGNLGLAMQRSGNAEEAINYYRKSLTRQKDQPTVWLALGDVLATTARLNEAQAAYEQALAYSAQYAHAYYRLGLLLTRCNKLEDAENALKKAVELDGEHIEAIAALGAFAARRGELKSALESFKRVQHLPTVPLPAQRGLQRLQIMQQGLERLTSEIQSATPPGPSLAQCYFQLGLAQYWSGNAAAAKDSFARAVAAQADWLDPLLWSGLCAALDGEGAAARKCWMDALRLQPENAMLREQLAYLALGMGLQKESETQFAEAQKRGRVIPPEHLKFGG